MIILGGRYYYYPHLTDERGFPGGSVIKNPSANAGDIGDSGFNPSVGKIPWSRKWQPTPVFLPRKFHGQRRLVGYSPWGGKELDMSENHNNDGKRRYLYQHPLHQFPIIERQR